jgi:membrane-associated protease RseP (regulator of RpoE activity)
MSDSQYFLMERKAMRPNFRTWLKHFFWFFLTFLTVTLTGSLGLLNYDVFPHIEDPQTWSDTFNLILSIPQIYFSAVANLFYLIQQNPNLLNDGLTFAVSLLFILTSHEAGHYIACRIYRVDATLPYFIPAPPMIAVGTFGAFIKIVSPMPSRKAVFDIGVAGPLAGFVALIPIACYGVLTAKSANIEDVVLKQGELIFSEPLFFELLHKIAGHNSSDVFFQNSFTSAAWVGFLVTALNLIPAGQLDGGHAVYAVFGEKIHTWIGRIAFLSMVILTGLGWYYFSSPSGLLFTIILAIMLKVGHPEPYDQTPLDFKRKLIAIITLIVFILCFMPFPIKIN